MKKFMSGKIDAGFLIEPTLSLGESQGRVRVVARVGDFFPRYQWGGIFASESYIKNNRGLLESLMDGYRESIRLIREDVKSAAAFGSRIFQMKKRVFQKALERNFANWEMDARIDISGLENCIKIQETLGAARTDIQISNMVFQL
jgi:ABC-type nitrate/sulfonate/bicarbonate transport system substrate-binding protein